MRAYLSVPIISNRSLETAKAMAKAIVDSGHQVASPWVLSDGETRPPASVNIFERDKAAVEASDLIIADVSMPSTGVGMEVMAAYLSGKRIILVAREGDNVTRMLRDMVRAEWVYFTDEASLLRGLQEKLRRKAP